MEKQPFYSYPTKTDQVGRRDSSTYRGTTQWRHYRPRPRKEGSGLIRLARAR